MGQVLNRASNFWSGHKKGRDIKGIKFRDLRAGLHISTHLFLGVSPLGVK